MKVNFISSYDQYISVQVSIHNGPWFIATVVYGHNTKPLREQLWADIKYFAACNSLPWCLMGDFNSCLYMYGKEGGNPASTTSMAALQGCLEDSEIFDCPSVGCFYTWSDRQDADISITCKLHTTLVNLAWLDVFPDSVTDFCNSGIAEHSPMLVSCFW